MERKIYLIAARTGCTCCSDQNFHQGPYVDKNEAQTQIDAWSRGENNPLASQYAKYGSYKLEECEAEEISGGRYIIDDRVWGPGIEDKVDR